MVKKLLVLPMDDDLAKVVSQALSNETAVKILKLLSEEPLSASKIAEKLEVPLTTVQYNVEKLLEVGLISVKEIRWSRKGREIKIYEPQEKYIVIAPKMTDRGRIIRELKSLLPALVIASLFGGVLGWYYGYYLKGKEIAYKAVPESMPVSTPAPMPTPTPMPKAIPSPVSVPEAAEVVRGGLVGWQLVFILLFVAVVIALFMVWRKARR